MRSDVRVVPGPPFPCGNDLLAAGDLMADGSVVGFGAIAQLGERLICIQEVVGSIPSGSTNCLVGDVAGGGAFWFV